MTTRWSVQPMSHEQVVDVVVPDGMDYAAMGVAFVVYFVLSFVWWGPLFGKKWAVLMGQTPGEQPPMLKPLLLQALGTVFLSYVLWNVGQAFQVTHDGEELAMGDMGVTAALMGAFFVWLGFIVPGQLGRVAWERATWSLFLINSGGHLVALVAMMLVFAFM